MRKLVYLFIIVSITSFVQYQALAQHQGHGTTTSGSKSKAHPVQYQVDVFNAYDCKAVYHLHENEIKKFSLPTLAMVTAITLPEGTKGEVIKLAGTCGDPTQTVLVGVKRKDASTGKTVDVLQFYDENLQFVGEIVLTHAPTLKN